MHLWSIPALGKSHMPPHQTCPPVRQRSFPSGHAYPQLRWITSWGIDNSANSDQTSHRSQESAKVILSMTIFCSKPLWTQQRKNDQLFIRTTPSLGQQPIPACNLPQWSLVLLQSFIDLILIILQVFHFAMPCEICHWNPSFEAAVVEC